MKRTERVSGLFLAAVKLPSVYTSATQIERSSELFVLDVFPTPTHNIAHIYILHGKGLEDILKRTKAIFSFCIQSYENVYNV